MIKIKHSHSTLLLVALAQIPAIAHSFPECHNNQIVFQSASGPETWSCISSDQPTSLKTVDVAPAVPVKVARQREANSPQITKEINKVLQNNPVGQRKPRSKQLSVGLQYSSSSKDQSLRETRNRSATIPLDFSLGLTADTELSFSVPLTYVDRELVSSSDVDNADEFGFGDIGIGLSTRFRNETRTRPSMTVNFGLGTPTGKTVHPYDSNRLSLGSGFWSASAGATFAKSLDPASVFLSFRYEHTFEDKQFGLNVKPGSSFEYGYGIGMSLNSALSVAGRIGGSLQSNTRVNGQVVEGSNSEPLQFITSSTFRLNRKSRLESTLSMGLNQDAADAKFGMTFIRDM